MLLFANTLTLYAVFVRWRCRGGRCWRRRRLKEQRLEAIRQDVQRMNDVSAARGTQAARLGRDHG